MKIQRKCGTMRDNIEHLSIETPAAPAAGVSAYPQTPATPSHTQPPTDGLRGVTGRPGPCSLVRHAAASEPGHPQKAGRCDV